jgi:hypothetical protein
MLPYAIEKHHCSGLAVAWTFSFIDSAKHPQTVVFLRIPTR